MSSALRALALFSAPILSVFPQTADQFKRSLQGEFLKTTWTANRDLPYRGRSGSGRGHREDDIEISVNDGKSCDLYSAKTGEQLNSNQITGRIQKGESLAVRKVDFGRTGLFFEMESLQKKRAKLRFAPASYAAYDLEQFKERVLCYFLLIAKYEPGRALDEEFGSLDRRLQLQQVRWSQANSDAEKLQAVHDGLSILDAMQQNREAREKTGLNQASALTTVANHVKLWRGFLVLVRREAFERDITAAIRGIEASDDPSHWEEQKAGVIGQIDRATRWLADATELRAEEKPDIQAQLDGYRAAVETAVRTARNRILQRLDVEYGDLRARFAADRKAFLAIPEKTMAEMARKVLAGDLLAGLAGEIRNNRTKYADASGATTANGLEDIDRSAETIKTAQEKTRAALAATQAKQRVSEKGAELKKLDSDYTSMDYNYSTLKATGGPRAARADLLNRMEANRRRAVSLGSSRAQQQLQRVQREQQELKK